MTEVSRVHRLPPSAYLDLTIKLNLEGDWFTPEGQVQRCECDGRVLNLITTGTLYLKANGRELADIDLTVSACPDCSTLTYLSVVSG